MKKFKKLFAYVLCICISGYGLPVAAKTDPASNVVRVELTDDQLAAAVGGNGSVDATLADYTVAGSEAQAVIANRASVSASYVLNVVDSNGNVLENLVSGTINSGEALLIRGTPTVAENSKVQVRVWNSGVPGLESKDTSWAP